MESSFRELSWLRSHVLAVTYSLASHPGQRSRTTRPGARLAGDSVVEERFAVRRFAVSRKLLRALPNLPEPPWDVKFVLH